MNFGDYIRQKRERLRRNDRRYSVRQVAQRIGVEPAYLSKIERGDFAPPSEEKIALLAQELGEDLGGAGVARCHHGVQRPGGQLRSHSRDPPAEFLTAGVLACGHFAGRAQQGHAAGVGLQAALPTAGAERPVHRQGFNFRAGSPKG